MKSVRTFTPVGRITTEAETDEQKLLRMARASLRRLRVERAGQNFKYCGTCGATLFARPKIRQGLRVCDDCAGEIPRLFCGRRASHVCVECGGIFSRIQLKMKNRNLYCKKCLKIKFKIDF